MGSIALPIALPLLAAFLMQPLAGASATIARFIGPVALAAAAWVLLDAAFNTELPFTVAMGGFAPPIGINLYVDRIALLLAIATPLLGLAFWPWLGKHDDRPREEALLLLMFAGTIGLALSGDLFNIYVFYELVSVASFGLVALNANGRSQVATVRYLLISAFGSMLILIGIAFVYVETGTLNLGQLGDVGPAALHNPLGLAAFVFMLIGFGVKAELFPVNLWVPEVYATAPTRISALLGGLISKVVVLIVVRLLVLAFDQPIAAQTLLVLGIIGALSGELAAWRAKDFNRMLAYSSIGQLGLVFIGFAISGTAGMLAGLAVALHHLIVKPGLFGIAAGWQGSLDALTGVARRTPLAAGLFVLFALSIVGVPPLPGFWAKLVVVIGLAQEGSALYMIALAAILFVTAVEANYLFRFGLKVFARPDDPAKVKQPSGHRLELAAAGVLGVLLLVVTLTIEVVGRELTEIAQETGDAALYTNTVYRAANPDTAPLAGTAAEPLVADQAGVTP